MTRHLVLFAREPGHEAREKGLSAPAADLFATFAAGWLEAARRVGARLVVATPPEDRVAWRRRFRAPENASWMIQRGGSLGMRLEAAARHAAAWGGHSILVGGDVAPDAPALAEAFRQLESGADAVLAPAPDGGVSLVSLSSRDCDLLADVAPRRRDVFATLSRLLAARRRRVAVVAQAPDVDRRRDLRDLIRASQPGSPLRSIARRMLSAPPTSRRRDLPPRSTLLTTPSGLRAPPAAA